MKVCDLLARPKSGRTYPEHAGRTSSAATAPSVPALKPRFALAECVHLGARVGRSCGSILRRCDLHGDLTTQHTTCTEAQRHCPRCPDFAPRSALNGHFNASVGRAPDGRLLLATRHGWTDSRLYLTPLAADLRPTGAPVPLALDHPLCRSAQEDPRLFTFRGRLHLSFTGLEFTAGEPRTHQLVAELGPDLRPVNVWAPSYAGRTYPREKNWVFFEGEGDGELYCVYSISPDHVVLRVRGTVAEEVARVPWNPVWGGHGHLRGGAPPVRVGDEWYHFAHGMTWRADFKTKQYALGAYTFDSRPPFAPKRGPVLLRTPPPDRPGWYASVVFPCGAILDGDTWRVSYGVHDERYEIGEWGRGELDTLLDGATDGVPAELVEAIDRTQSLPGWCSREKAHALADLVLRERPAVCVEVGVFGGRSLLPVSLALDHLGTGEAHGVDPWSNAIAVAGEHPPQDAAWLAGCDFGATRAACLSALDREGVAGRVRVHRVPSHEAAPLFAAGSIDLLHVDGNHSPDHAERDVRDWLPRVRPGGWVAFDDSHWASVVGALALLDRGCELIRDYGTWRLYRRR